MVVQKSLYHVLGSLAITAARVAVLPGDFGSPEPCFYAVVSREASVSLSGQRSGSLCFHIGSGLL